MNFLRGNRSDTSQFCKLRVILLLPKSHDEDGDSAPHHAGLPAWPPSSSPSPPSSASPSPPSPSSSGGLLQRHDFGAAGLNSKGTYDCEFPPKLSVEQIKANLFSTIPALFPLSRNDFYLALAKEMVLYEEEKRLVASHEVVAEKFFNKERITVFLLPKDECPPPPQTDNSALPEEKEMERLAKEIERDESVWSTREIIGESGLSPSTPSSTTGSRGIFQRKKPLAMSVDEQRSAGTAAAMAASKGLRGEIAEKPEKVRRGSVFSRRRRNKELNDQKNSERLAGEYAGRLMSSSRSYDDLSRSREYSLDSDTGSREASLDPDDLAYEKQGADVFMSGYLVKQGGNRKNWKKRFCVLTADSIRYYGKKKDPTPIAAIPLDEIMAIARESRTSRAHCFALHTRHAIYFPSSSATARETHECLTTQTRRRTYYMCAPNEEDLLAWMHATKLQLIERRKVMQEEEESGAGIEGWLTVWVVVSPGNEANLGRGFSLRGRWKRYWCFISNSDHCLYYVKDPSTKDKREGNFPLQGVTVEFSQQRRFCFSLKSQQKVLLLSADSEREMEEWMNAISRRRLIRPTNTETQAQQPIDWEGRKTVQLQLDRLTLVQTANVLDVLSRIPAEEPEVLFFRKMMLITQREARQFDSLMINHFLPARLVPAALTASASASDPASSPFSIPSPSSSSSSSSSFLPATPSSPRGVAVGGGFSFAAPASTGSVIVPSPATGGTGHSDLMSSGFLTRTNSLPNLQYSSHHRSGGGLGGQPSGSDLIATAATGLPSSSSLSTAQTAVAMSTSLSSVRTISSGSGRKLNLYFHFFDVDNRQPAAPMPSERGGGSSSSGDDDAAAGGESTESTTPLVRRNGDVSAGFGYRRFNTEMLISRQNMPLPPPPVAPRNGRAFLRTATGGSAADADAAATASPDGADSSSGSSSTQPAGKKPATSLVENLKFERPGRRSLEVMSEEVTGENGELRPSLLHDQPSPRLHNSEPAPTATDQPASPRAANPPVSSSVPAIRRRPSDAATRGSNNMLSASHRSFSPHTKLSLAINPDATIATAIAEVMSKYQRIYKKKQPSELESESLDETKRAEPGNFILQVKGRREYVFDSNDTTIAQLAYVANCLAHWDKIEFVIRERSALSGHIDDKIKYYKELQRVKQTTPRSRKGEDSPQGTRSRRVAGRWNPATATAATVAAAPATSPPDSDAAVEVDTSAADSAQDGSEKERQESNDDDEPSVEIVEQQCYDVDGLDDVPLVLKILGVEQQQAEIFDVNPNLSVSVECGLYYGPMQLGIYRTERMRKPNAWSDRPQVFHTHLPLSHIPKETRACFRLIAYQGKDEWAIGWGNVALFDHAGRFLTGGFEVHMWEGDRPSLMAPCVPNFGSGVESLMRVRASSISPPSLVPIAYTRPYTALAVSPAASVVPTSPRTDPVASALPPSSSSSPSATSTNGSRPDTFVRRLLSPSHACPSSEAFSDGFATPCAGSSPADPRSRFRAETVAAAADGLAPFRTSSFDEEDFIDHELQILKQIINQDIFYELSTEEKQMMWKHRDACIREHPRSLAKLLLSIDWLDRSAVAQLYDLLDDWTELGPMDALELLDARFPDEQVRAFACRCLQNLSDEELAVYVPQLVQALKYDTYHHSALSQFLLSRGLRSRLIVGQRLFWEVKVASQIERNVKPKWDPTMASSPASSGASDEREVRGSGGEAMALRYGLFAEAYLHGIGAQHREEIMKQVFVMEELLALSHALKKIPKNKRDAFLKYKLAQFPFPKDGITLPLEPRMQVKGFVVDKCKALDSFTVPLRLVFDNKEDVGDPITVIYKAGDDLRQDALTLQLIRVMDTLWKDEGLDLRLTTYGVMATGEKEGIIEAVLNSTTVAEIAKEAGGATAVFNPQTISNWLKQQNPDDTKYAMAVENFIYSCAGYCVACYILGIGDRHNDNIMVTKTGHMFHIDFAHFLGNVLRFGPIVRDKAPFVLTPEMVYIMGGRESQQFQRFIRLCCRAYNVVRSHANVFTNLFAMMISCGIPQLSSKNDMNYLMKALAPEMTEEEAAKTFTGLIYKSLDTKTTQLNFAVHILAHRD